jgi:hypothetical protein
MEPSSMAAFILLGGTAYPEDVMSTQVDRLPAQVPVGTRYVIEGRRGGDGDLRISLRYLEFPDGRQVRLPVELGERTRVRRSRGRPGRRIAARK